MVTSSKNIRVRSGHISNSATFYDNVVVNAGLWGQQLSATAGEGNKEGFYLFGYEEISDTLVYDMFHHRYWGFTLRCLAI